jgi:hypothetical protein
MQTGPNASTPGPADVQGAVEEPPSVLPEVFERLAANEDATLYGGERAQALRGVPGPPHVDSPTVEQFARVGEVEHLRVVDVGPEYRGARDRVERRQPARGIALHRLARLGAARVRVRGGDRVEVPRHRRNTKRSSPSSGETRR